MPNSTGPSWKGKNGNLTFQEIQQELYERDFSKVEINKPCELKYIFGKGFCLQSRSSRKKFEVKSKEKTLDIFLVHNSTDTGFMADTKSSIIMGSTTPEIFELKEYDLSYEIVDNTIHGGTTCTDYRKRGENYGDCNYRTVGTYLFNSYSCYPPWIETLQGKECETDVPTKDFQKEVRDKIWNDIWYLTSGVRVDMMKQCLPPCYQVKLKWEEIFSTTWNKYDSLRIYDNVQIIRTKKAAYSFDGFMLMVELGSALGLWLGK